MTAKKAAAKKSESIIQGTRFEMQANPYKGLPAVNRSQVYALPWYVEGVGGCNIRRRPLHREKYTVIGRAVMVYTASGISKHSLSSLAQAAGIESKYSELTPKNRDRLLRALQTFQDAPKRWATEKETEEYIAAEIQWRKDCLEAALKAAESLKRHTEGVVAKQEKLLKAAKARDEAAANKLVNAQIVVQRFK